VQEIETSTGMWRICIFLSVFCVSNTAPKWYAGMDTVLIAEESVTAGLCHAQVSMKETRKPPSSASAQGESILQLLTQLQARFAIYGPFLNLICQIYSVFYSLTRTGQIYNMNGAGSFSVKN